MWKGLDEADSDPESIDTPMEDPLKQVNNLILYVNLYIGTFKL